jgi:hypothetical protein
MCDSAYLARTRVSDPPSGYTDGSLGASRGVPLRIHASYTSACDLVILYRSKYNSRFERQKLA